MGDSINKPQQHIGLFGGSFDPVHMGHILAANVVQKKLSLDEIRFIPAARSPFKKRPQTNDEHRIAMLELAIQPYSGFSIDILELASRAPSYTIDTLQKLAQLYAHDHLYLLIGMDAWQGFERWRNWQDIVNYCHIVVMTRPGYVAPKLNIFWQHHKLKSNDDIRQFKCAKLLFVEVPSSDASSSSLRKRIGGMREVGDDLDLPVENYIKLHKLYR